MNSNVGRPAVIRMIASGFFSETALTAVAASDALDWMLATV